MRENPKMTTQENLSRQLAQTSAHKPAVASVKAPRGDRRRLSQSAEAPPKGGGAPRTSNAFPASGFGLSADV